MEIKRSDVNALESRLEKFTKDLPDQQQNVLKWILARAKAASDEEVSDADLDSVSGGLADAAGFTDASTDSVEVSGTVKWSR
ncbi:MAG TPA: hypothetical protein VIE43_20150 [Thermoanaerobaculia bacterium]|jgi:hypothetical protein|nr:hypothetical protein [Thermoanaerobaculia bacterium]